MERLETKKIKGRVYYYYSKWAWVDGKCRRVWQKYLGRLEDWVHAIDSAPSILHAEVFRFGLPAALWLELERQEIVSIVDRLCPKRAQGLSVGEYLSVAAVNRACEPVSKRGIWDWFNGSVLRRLIPHANRAALASQRFWDHMDCVEEENIVPVWQQIIGSCLKREGLEPGQVCYDGTNFYTFIGTFNSRCNIARRGKNKQGRNNLRQVSYAVFCSREDQVPLFFDVYPGNRGDSPEFAQMVERFDGFLKSLAQGEGCIGSDGVTVVFDKGNNSLENIRRLDEQGLHFVGSVKLGEHKHLAEISNNDSRFTACKSEGLSQCKTLRLEQNVYGAPRTVVVCFNQRLFTQQLLTLNNDIATAVEKLTALKCRLEDRAEGRVKTGKAPTVQSITRQVAKILKRPFLKSIIKTAISEGPALCFDIDTERSAEVADTYLGKKLLITSRKEWSSEEIVRAYHGQYVIEHLFRQMKDRTHGSWWPLNHWTDQKIRIHGLYCTIAALLHAMLMRRVRLAGMNISMDRLIGELDSIHEVVNAFRPKRRGKPPLTQTTLTKRDEIQQKLVEILQLNKALPSSTTS